MTNFVVDPDDENTSHWDGIPWYRAEPAADPHHHHFPQTMRHGNSQNCLYWCPCGATRELGEEWREPLRPRLGKPVRTLVPQTLWMSGGVFIVALTVLFLINATQIGDGDTVILDIAGVFTGVVVGVTGSTFYNNCRWWRQESEKIRQWRDRAHDLPVV